MNDNEKLIFIETAIKTLFNKEVPTLTPDLKLSDLGLDSLDIVELQMYYEDSINDDIVTDKPIVSVANLMAVMR